MYTFFVKLTRKLVIFCTCTWRDNRKKHMHWRYFSYFVVYLFIFWWVYLLLFGDTPYFGLYTPHSDMLHTSYSFWTIPHTTYSLFHTTLQHTPEMPLSNKSICTPYSILHVQRYTLYLTYENPHTPLFKMMYCIHHTQFFIVHTLKIYTTYSIPLEVYNILPPPYIKNCISSCPCWWNACMHVYQFFFGEERFASTRWIGANKIGFVETTHVIYILN